MCTADLGVYRGDPSALHFPPTKTGTLDFVNPDRPGVVGYWETSHGAPWFILLTSMAHYAAYVTQMAVAAAYFAAPLTATAVLPVLLVAGPLFQAMGGAGANTMHEYEGFQVRRCVPRCIHTPLTPPSLSGHHLCL